MPSRQRNCTVIIALHGLVTEGIQGEEFFYYDIYIMYFHTLYRYQINLLMHSGPGWSNV